LEPQLHAGWKEAPLAKCVDMLKGYKTVNPECEQLYREYIEAYEGFVAHNNDYSSE
jgi:hypothetical protein